MVNRNLTPVSGFTLIELIIVIVIIGILAISVAPQFVGRQGVDELAYQARLVNVLRQQQQQAMQNVTEEACVLITDNRFGKPAECTDTTLPEVFERAYEGLSSAEAEASVEIVTIPANTIWYFNGLGCIGTSTDPACGSTSLEIVIAGTSAAGTEQRVCVESQGYVHRGACEQ